MLFRLALFAFLIVSSIPIQQASAHALFNSAESTIGNNRVQIATDPEIPTVGEKSRILLHVTDLDLNDVNRFTMGIRIFYNDIQIDGVPPQSIDGAFWDFDYTFKTSGNHIFRVDLYDPDLGVVTHTFNLSTQNPFGYIFIYVIASGAIGLAVLVGYIYLPKKLKKLTRP
ncbi:MAG TPA: hypothetical protein VGA92_01630 [Candidatus Nitrosotenuis sp.]